MFERPIRVFTNTEQLYNCLDYWKRMLFLEDWTIKVSVCACEDFINESSCGENCVDYINKGSVIHILRPEDYCDNRIQKYCAEKILVHELLHCKYNLLDMRGSYELSYLDMVQHQKLEEMAKTLIMVKYNVSREYFDTHTGEDMCALYDTKVGE